MQHSKSTFKSTSGFTLIELLVVIAIIAILASILFPVFARARENARRASCQSNEKQIGLGFMMYVQDYDEKLPTAWGWNGTPSFWAAAIEPYTKSRQLFYCPSDTLHNTSSALTTSNISYGYNYAYLQGTALAAIDLPSETLLIGDTGQNPTGYTIDHRDISALNPTRQPNPIHLEGCNFAFMDGHVKWLKPEPIIANYGTSKSIWDLN